MQLICLKETQHCTRLEDYKDTKQRKTFRDAYHKHDEIQTYILYIHDIKGCNPSSPKLWVMTWQIIVLTHWGGNKMVDIFQTTF